MAQDSTSPIITPPISLIEAQQKADIDMQVRTAKAYPRDLARLQETILGMAESAERKNTDPEKGYCFFAVPRDGKTIKGPSVRLAEIVMSQWGNARAGARVIEVGAKSLTAQAVFMDLEQNTAVTFEVERPILYSNGGRYSDIMIVTTGNAACKIAFRNAVFSGIPQIWWLDAYQAVLRIAAGEDQGEDALHKGRQGLVTYFSKLGKTEADLLAHLGRKNLRDITGSDLLTMKGLAAAIADGECTIDEVFGRGTQGATRRTDAPPPVAKTSDVNALFQPHPDDPQAPLGTDDVPWEDDPEPEQDTAPVKAAPIPGPPIEEDLLWKIQDAASAAGMSPTGLRESISADYNKTLAQLTQAEGEAVLARFS